MRIFLVYRDLLPAPVPKPSPAAEQHPAGQAGQDTRGVRYRRITRTQCTSGMIHN